MPKPFQFKKKKTQEFMHVIALTVVNLCLLGH